MEEADLVKKCYTIMAPQRLIPGGVSQFGVMGPLGGILAKSNQGACYADLRHYPLKGDTLTWTTNRCAPDNEASNSWIKLLLDPDLSPYRSIHPFLTSLDVSKAIEFGYILRSGNAELNANLAFNFLIATRLPFEFPARAKSYHDLVTIYGVEPRLAFVITMGFTLKDSRERVLLRPEGFRRDPEDKRKWIKDVWGGKRYFAAEYGYKDVAPGDNPQLSRTSNGVHNAWVDLTTQGRRLYLSTPKLHGGSFVNRECFEKGETSRGYVYGEKQAWDIWNDPKDRALDQQYERCDKDLKSVTAFCLSLVNREVK